MTKDRKDSGFLWSSDVTPIRSLMYRWYSSGVGEYLGEYLGLNITNEQVRVVGSHSRTHVNSRDLMVELNLEREAVEQEV